MKHCLLVLLTLISLTAYGQKYKIKKDVLQKDKVAIGKVEGKVNLIKSDLTITTMDDTPVLIVKGGHYTKVLPETPSVLWYTFSMPQLNKEIIVKMTNNYFGTKQFLKHEFHNKGIHFYADGLHAEELAVLEDYSAQLQADTMGFYNILKLYNENLIAYHVDRQKSAAVTFAQLRGSSDIAIIQGKTGKGEPNIIGKIVYIRKPGDKPSDPPRKHTIQIYKKLSQEINFNGKKTTYLSAAYINLLDNIPSIYSYQEGNELTITGFSAGVTDSGLETAKKAANLLVKEGYL